MNYKILELNKKERASTVVNKSRCIATFQTEYRHPLRLLSLLHLSLFPHPPPPPPPLPQSSPSSSSSASVFSLICLLLILLLSLSHPLPLPPPPQSFPSSASFSVFTSLTSASFSPFFRHHLFFLYIYCFLSYISATPHW